MYSYSKSITSTYVPPPSYDRIVNPVVAEYKLATELLLIVTERVYTYVKVCACVSVCESSSLAAQIQQYTGFTAPQYCGTAEEHVATRAYDVVYQPLPYSEERLL